ncbi:hypothetical protein L2E82_01187 [Cichorium intybus]|uniref:Uncharacterized protein n=1 Tax=Cichorium intybus TaxID=13427 RepID=A0ACB9GYW7_CICIN|nr:hypothetical protein L2E82_01187 [Cichorium intybus]
MKLYSVLVARTEYSIFKDQRKLKGKKILQIAAKETMDPELIDFVDLQKVAEKTALLCPLRTQSCSHTFSSSVSTWQKKTKLAKAMAKMVVNHLGLTLTKKDLQNVVDLMEPYGQITNMVEYLNPLLDWTTKTKLPHVVWVAGRGPIAALLPNYDVVDNLWLETLFWEGVGCMKITKAKTGENNLSLSELKQAQEIAIRMVMQDGWGPDDNPTVYHHDNVVTALSIRDNHEYRMAAKVEKMYYEKAKAILWSNENVLEMIVEELLEFEILTGKDLERIILANGGIRDKVAFYLQKSNR